MEAGQGYDAERDHREENHGRGHGPTGCELSDGHIGGLA